MTRRDFARAGPYGVLFAAVVVLVWRHSAGDQPPGPRRVSGASFDAATLERSEGLPEIRRVVQHMLVR